MGINISDLLKGPVTPKGPTLDEENLSPLHLSLDWLAAFVADVKQSRAFTRYQYVDVVFNSVANGDTDIAHTLKPLTPDLVDWVIVGINFASAPATAPVIYRNTGANARPWGTGYIVLRSNVASLSCTLRLTLRTPA